VTRHDWQPSDRTSWSKLGAPLTTYVCTRCRAAHGGAIHRGRCGDRCGNYYPSLGRVPACKPEGSAS